MRATPERHRCTAAGSRHAAAATFAWTASKDRAAATLSSSGNNTPSTIMSPAGKANPRSWTEISLGARAHTPTNSASTAPVKRYALGSPGSPAGDRPPRLALTSNEVEV